MGDLLVKNIDGKIVKLDFEKGETILKCLQRNNIPINAVCNGLGKCLKCKVIVYGDEAKKLHEDDKHTVLACQTKLTKDTFIEIPSSSLLSTSPITMLGYEPPVQLDPPVKKIKLKIMLGPLREKRGNEIKILKAVNKHGLKADGFHVGIRDTLLPLFDVAKDKITVTVRDNEIIHLEKGDEALKAYGVAVDIGTTQLSLFLVDLLSGCVIDFISELNKQEIFGGDVITRLSYIISKLGNFNLIRKITLDQIKDVLNKLVKKNSVNPNHIYEIVVVGNTLMMHIFHGEDPSGLSRYPYKSSMIEARKIFARNYGLNVNPLAKTYSPPNISGYIGADIAADIISSEIYKSDKNILMMDIGTNTEIILRYDNKLYGCSTPSGPALEGGHIKYGMRAEKGAIETVYIDPETLNINYKTVGGVEPVGLCGSGVIDAVVELVKIGAVKKDGSIDEKHKITSRINSGRAVIIAEKANGEKITLSQEDIREFQKAKAAIQAGYTTLLKYTNTQIEQIEEVIIAGSFGLHINLDSGRRLGIIPQVEDYKVKYLGNLAGAGARVLLKNIETRKICEKIAGSIEYVELGQLKFFQDTWINSLYLS
ncbi:MAG: ASKHA domain-containing protein [Candidatus Odinarchaeota archaeon]